MKFSILTLLVLSEEVCTFNKHGFCTMNCTDFAEIFSGAVTGKSIEKQILYKKSNMPNGKESILLKIRI